MKKLLVLILILCAAAGAQSPESRILRTEAVVEASLDDVWQSFTTREGVLSWMVPAAEVDFRLGGAIRTNYDKNAGVGGPGTITHTIVAFEPKRMVAFRTTPPEDAQPIVGRIRELLGVERFEPLAADRTRVTITGIGFGSGSEWEQTYAFFDRGNRYEMDLLVKHFAHADTNERTEKALALLRGRTRFQPSMDGRFVIADGWLGDAAGMRPHAHLIYGIDPESGALRFWNFGEGGEVAGGAVRLVGEKSVAHEWNTRTPNGKPGSYYIQLIFDAPDTYRMTMRDQAESAPMLELTYRRVQHLPAAFKKIKPAGR